jgi:DMSO/TMAO reductase YedYZ molybdopterin-dependent catalytic subunit
MMKYRRRRWKMQLERPTAQMLLVLAGIVFGSMFGLAGCTPPRPAPPVEAPEKVDEPRTLQPEEVREYEGEKLSSVDDFRENSIKGPQQVDREKYRLRITGLVDEPAEYRYEEVLERDTYRKAVRLDCVEGWSVDILWEGVLVRDLIAESGPKSGARTVIFHAVDGYTTSFPARYFGGERDILLAYKMNGIEIPPERGFPFMLVAEDKWGYKWIKWVEEIELSSDVDYKGYWESRGYSNTGDLDKPFFGR